MWEAFRLIGHRPEILRQLVGRVAINHGAPSFSDLLKQDASIWHSQIWEEYENDYHALSPLHQAILSLLIKLGRAWSPFTDDSLKYYKKFTNQKSVPISSVQSAILSLRENGFIWQASRGSYALEDEGFAEWFKHAH